MKEIVHFFWTRWHRALQMDETNRLLGKPTHFWTNADEWIEAYKKTLSSGKKKDFDKEFARLEEELRLVRRKMP